MSFRVEMLDEEADLVVQDRMRFRVRCAYPHYLGEHATSSPVCFAFSVLEGVALETSGARTPARVNVTSH